MLMRAFSSLASATLGASRLPAEHQATAAATVLTAVSMLLPSVPLCAQTPSDAARGGPYGRLIVQNAMIIPGHGGPAYGPADIIIEGGTIAQIISYNGVTGRPANAALPPAERTIDATGMYVMPA